MQTYILVWMRFMELHIALSWLHQAKSGAAYSKSARTKDMYKNMYMYMYIVDLNKVSG